jgi:putative spermidine/putrescine transport system permease protein
MSVAIEAPVGMKRSEVVMDKLSLRYARLRNLFAWCIYAFIVVPTLIVIPISFGGSGDLVFPPRVWTLELYQELFTSRSWLSSIAQSAKVAAMVTVGSMLVGVPAAYGLVRFTFPGKRLVLLLIMSPMVVPIIVIALGVYLYFSLLHIVGSTAALVISHVALVTPLVVITNMAGVKKLDPAIEFAASIMGSKPLAVFLTVVLPQLRPSIIASALFAFVLSFDEVVIAWFITSPNTITLPVKMYSSIAWEISPVIAAVSALLTMLSLILCCVSVMFQPPGRDPSH